MKKQLFKILNITLGLFSLCAIFSTTANAHEPRDGVTSSFNISVGHRSEPVFAGQANAFDLFVRNASDDSDANEVEVDIEVYVMRLKKEAHNARIRKITKLTGDLRRDFSDPNRFNIHYLPRRPGTYGFIIKGFLNDEPILEKFVCGEGTLNPDGRSFGCTQKLQKF